MEHLPFGVFNPRFYGVSLFVGGDDRRDALERYEQTKDPSERARETDSPSLNEVSTLSAIDHEMRHFHDFLLSPLGTITMGLRMQASINGFQAMQALTDCRGKFVPVPLTRWIEWDTGKRQRWIDSNGSFFGTGFSQDLVDLPHAVDLENVHSQSGHHTVPGSFTPEQALSAYVLGASQAYASMRTWRQRRVSQYDMDVSADDVFEAAAHLVQLQAVWTGQGEAAAGTFLDFVLKSSATYLQPLQVLWEVLKGSSHIIGFQRMTELFTWMLLGPWEQIESSGYPASRYFQVLELAALSPDDEIFVGQMPAPQLFDNLDARTASRSWKDNLASALVSADRRNGSYSRLAQNLRGGYFDALFAISATWHEDQRSARQTFLQDPESFAHPLRYLSEDRFPLPFVESRLGWMVHERADSLNLPNQRAIALDTEGKRVLSYIGQLRSASSTAGVDNALTARLVTHLVDFLFGDEPVLDLYEHWCRSQIEPLVGKKLVSVY